MNTSITKAHYGWNATTVNGLTEVDTMRRHSGRIASVKRVLTQAVGNMIGYSPFSAENQALKPLAHEDVKTATKGNIEKAHKAALDHFHFSDSPNKAIQSKDPSRIADLEKRVKDGETICLIGK